MPPPRGQKIIEEEPTVCAKCELTFKSFVDYHQHKMRSRRHITCEVCSQDFESYEACKQHHDLMHSHEQNMNCPGCGKHFTRLGGLMSHIELTECAFFKKEELEKNRKLKQEWYSNAQNARNFMDYGRTAGDFGNNSPNPFATQPGKLVRGPEGVVLVTAKEAQAAREEDAQAARDETARQQASHEQRAREQSSREHFARVQADQFQASLDQVSKRTGYFTADDEHTSFNEDDAHSSDFEDDLISFEDLGDELGKGWGEATPKVIKPLKPIESIPIFKQADFPALGPAVNQIDIPAASAAVALLEPKVENAWVIKPNLFAAAPVANPLVESKAGNAWDSNQKLFANAPPAIAPPAQLLRGFNVKDAEEEESEDPLNPDSKSFNAKKYYIDLIGKFRCPHRRCGKTVESSSAFVQHLKSPTHRNEKLQCINCLRYFATATALTQHCEYQGVRCKVRQTSEYDGVVDAITGGTAITAGRHVDDTIKYAVNPTFSVASVVDAHRARMEEKNQKAKGFWDNNTPKW